MIKALTFLTAGLLGVAPVFAADTTSNGSATDPHDTMAQHDAMPNCTKVSDPDARQTCMARNRGADHDARGRAMNEDKMGTDTLQKMKSGPANDTTR